MGIEKFLQKICVQTAVYWGNPIPNGYGGMSYDVPIEIGCRWEDKAKVISDNTGQEIISLAEVLVTQDLSVQGILYLGKLTDLSTVQKANPALIENGAYSVKRIDKVPMIKSTTVFVRTVYL